MKTSRALLWLVALQVLVASILFSKFLSGQFYFAYNDIGSDSFGQVVPDAIHTVRSFMREGFTGWSFEFGLGGPTAMLAGDPFAALGMLGGPDGVLPMRIWVYVLKLLLGGWAFFLLAMPLNARREPAVIAALAYTFCGFVVINGQWDLEATEFVFFPLLLWAVRRAVRTADVVALPLVVAATLVFSVFFVSVGVFLVFTGLAFIALSEQPLQMFRRWLVKVAPLTLLGFCLAAPRLLPLVLQMLDSSRVSGGDSLFQKVVGESLRISEWPLIQAQVAALFHKDIFGVGSAYKGYWNYLEGPEFFVGVSTMLLIPQLWGGNAKDRKHLALGLAALAAYVLLPIFRNAAMGFAAPYFRVSALWVSLILLLLGMRAIDLVLRSGIRRDLLLAGLAVHLLLLALLVTTAAGGAIAMPHALAVLALALLGAAVLWSTTANAVAARHLPRLLLALVALEAVVIARPSYLEGRTVITPDIAARAWDDGTKEALAAIRAADRDVFRIEKAYDSVSLVDAHVQDYMGVKSYAMHSRGVVDFYVGAGLLPARLEGSANYTNWLPNMGSRFMLNSLLGVKYVISRRPLDWPGFEAFANASGLLIYRNTFALPLGIVQSRQIGLDDLKPLANLSAVDANLMRDVALINGVILDQSRRKTGESFDLDAILRSRKISLADHYAAPVRELQRSGLQIKAFSSNRIVGDIQPQKPGILVFSIPFSNGWRLHVDGRDVPLWRANFGMLAADVPAGVHHVELNFRLPGQGTGWWIGLVAACILMSLALANLGASALSVLDKWAHYRLLNHEKN